MTDEVEQLRALLKEALEEYVDHQSWRCGHPDRYPHEPDCPCELLSFEKRAWAVLGANTRRKP